MSLNQSFNSIPEDLASAEFQSRYILSKAWKAMLTVCTITVAGMITNTLVMVTIARTKSLHNKSQFIIFSHSLAEALSALFVFCTNFRKLIYFFSGTTDVHSPLVCVFLQVGLLITSKVAMYNILALCIDRLAVISIPIRYKQLNVIRYIVAMNTICWGYSLLHEPFFILSYRRDVQYIPTCDLPFEVDSRYNAFLYAEADVVTILTVVLYGIAIGIVCVRYWGKKWQNESQRATWSRQIQLGAFKLMMTVICVHLLCWGTVIAAIRIITSLDPVITLAVAPYVAAVMNVNAASHFFVYVYLSGPFRKAFMDMLKRKNTVGTGLL